MYNNQQQGQQQSKPNPNKGSFQRSSYQDVQLFGNLTLSRELLQQCTQPDGSVKVAVTVYNEKQGKYGAFSPAYAKAPKAQTASRPQNFQQPQQQGFQNFQQPQGNPQQYSNPAPAQELPSDFSF